MAGRNGMTQGGIGSLSPAPGGGSVRPGPRPVGPVRPGPRPFGPDRELQPIPFSTGLPVTYSNPDFDPRILTDDRFPIGRGRGFPVMPSPPDFDPRKHTIDPRTLIRDEKGLAAYRQNPKFAKVPLKRHKDRFPVDGEVDQAPEDLPFLFLSEGGQVPRKIYDPARMGFVDNPAYIAQQSNPLEQAFSEPEPIMFEPSLPSGGPNTPASMGDLGLLQRNLFGVSMSGYNPTYEALGLTPPPPRTPNPPVLNEYGLPAFVLPTDYREETYMPSGGGKGGKGGTRSTTITRPPGKGGVSPSDDDQSRLVRSMFAASRYGQPELAPNERMRRYMRRPGAMPVASVVEPKQATYGPEVP